MQRRRCVGQSKEAYIGEKERAVGVKNERKKKVCTWKKLKSSRERAAPVQARFQLALYNIFLTEALRLC